jgi:hypothetical protein
MRQIRITQLHGEVMIDFLENVGRNTWKSQYSLLIPEMDFTSIQIVGVMRAWFDRDDSSFMHPELTITEEY